MLISAASRILRGEVAARTRRLSPILTSLRNRRRRELCWRGALVGRMVAGEICWRQGRSRLSVIFSKGRRAKRCGGASGIPAPRGRAPAGAAFYRTSIVVRGCRAGASLSAGRLAWVLARRRRWGTIAVLAPADREALSRLGVRFGTESVYFEPLLRTRYYALSFAPLGGTAGLPVPTLPSARRLAKPTKSIPRCRSHFMRLSAFGFWADDLATRSFGAARRGGKAPRTEWSLRGWRRAIGDRGHRTSALRRLLTGLGYRVVIDAGEEPS